ncbi:hypothetical protein C8T65DRAFT_584462 [Cerioporus squamosus]|nr:hypothetical protein C8T65DRAFT_584462 [Cerioporus squamosus]
MKAGRVNSTLEELDTVSALYPIKIAPSVNDTTRLRLRAQEYREVPVLRPGQEALFRSLWQLNIPVVVRGLHNRMQGSWTPDSFVRTHGQETVTMLKSGKLPSQKVTVARFFEEFAKSAADRGYAVKVKDWPPSSSFKNDFPQNYDAFMQAVPMQSYTCWNGFRNLIAHYGIPPGKIASLRPDVGPKAYIATPDLPQEGSTRLHLDITCAVNILPWTSSGDSEATGAEWYIFDPRDLAQLRAYLQSRCCSRAGNDSERIKDPIHAQLTFIDDEILSDLSTLGVRPYKIRQRLGDAVFIPAGAAHQVSNVQSCIKIACDFLCIEGIPESSKVVQDFRRERLPDILQLNIVLWDAWVSLAYHAVVAGQRLRAPTLTRHEKKNKYRRETSRGHDDSARRKKQRTAQMRDGGPPPSRDYACPITNCPRRCRRFSELHGVFTHLYVLCVV